MSVLPAFAVIKPTGIFSASGSGGDDVTGIYQKNYLRGVLIRVPWSAIKPTLTGAYSWTTLDSAIDNAKSYNRSYSLAVVAGGVGSPAWLTTPTNQGGAGAPYVEYSFQTQTNIKLPLFWNSIVQTHLQQLAAALAVRYGGDADLQLVYVTQMTTNGIEGHLQGVSMNDMVAAGYTDTKWIAAAKQTAKSFADAFTDKAIAFEVHDVNGGATVPTTIINDLWNDPTLGERVGAAIWWLSGRTTYQSALLTALAAYPGDIYAQVISPSSDDTYFDNGYPAVYTQGKSLGVRYIEPWENEFKNGTNNANGEWDATFVDYNNWADSTFGGSGGGGAPVTVNFYPTHDSYVYQGTPNGTNGTATTVQLNDATQDRHGYLKFSISGIAGTVTSATLKLKCSISQSGNTRVYPVSNTTWTEGALTWNNKPAMGAQADSKTNVAAGQVISLNVTSLVTGNGNRSFGLQASSSSTVQYYTKERTGTADDPVLQVTYQP